MAILTKKQILSVIFEQFEMDEMANTPSENWTKEGVSNKFDLNGTQIYNIREEPISDAVKIGTKDPDGKIEDNIVYSKEARKPLNGGGQILYFFNNFDGKRYWIEFNGGKDGNKTILHAHLPRNARYSTPWKGAKTYDNLDPKRRQKMETRRKETWAKRQLFFDDVNSFFMEQSVRTKLTKCGAPRVVGDKEHTANINLVNQPFNYLGPNIKFGFHGIRDGENVQDSLNNILNGRARIDDGDPIEDIDTGTPGKHTRLYGGYSYPGGEWSHSQRTWDETLYEETPIMKLAKKAVQHGVMGVNFLSVLTGIGRMDNYNMYEMTLQFETRIAMRMAKEHEGHGAGFLINPITVSVFSQIPDEINDMSELNVKDYYDFFSDITKQAFEKLKSEVLQLSAQKSFDKLWQYIEPENLEK